MTRPRAIVVSFVLVAMLGTVAARPASAQRVTLDAGLAQVGWLSPDNWGESFGVQAYLGASRRVRALIGVRGIVGLGAPGGGIGFVSRRERQATGMLGVEGRIASVRRASLHLSASVAGSRGWLQYTNSDGTTTDFEGGWGWVRGVYGARVFMPVTARWGVHLQSEIHPRFGDTRSWNPVFVVGVGF